MPLWIECRHNLQRQVDAHFHFREINNVAKRYTSCVVAAITIGVMRTPKGYNRYDPRLRSATTRIARVPLVRYLATVEQKKVATVAENPHEDRPCERAGDNAHGFDAIGLSSKRRTDECLVRGSSF